LFQGASQANETNYTTRPGAVQIEEADCLAPQVLGGDGLLPIPGFDGLAMLAVGGHTPGSQIFVARMAPEVVGWTWIFTGDAVNHIDGVRLNLPKPTLYSLLVVPEDAARLEEVRLLLREVSTLPRTGLLVSHDQLQLEASHVPNW
jgi:glyoxylase-like metal-dependent hydrolase (beta-lactamase superfamily II)